MEVGYWMGAELGFVAVKVFWLLVAISEITRVR